MKSVFLSVLLVLSGFSSMTSYAAQELRSSQEPMRTLQFRSGALQAMVQFESEIQVSKDAPILVQFQDAATGLPVEIAEQVKVILWMPDMGHGSGPTQATRVLEKDGSVKHGAYRFVNVFFIMSGNWEVRVQLRDAQGKTELQSFKVNVP